MNTFYRFDILTELRETVISVDNHLEEILVELKTQDIKFIVCGGVAAVLHGVERMTMDIDISLDLDNDNLKKFLEVLKKLNLKPRAPIPPESILDPEKRKIMIGEKGALVFTFLDPDKPFRQIDIFLEEDKSYNRLRQFIEKIDIGGTEINILSIEKLIEMKKDIDPPREKDIMDIKELGLILKQKISND